MAEDALPNDPSLETVIAQLERDLPPGTEEDRDVELALRLARHLQARARDLQTPPEKRQQAELNRLLQNPEDKATLIQMTDQAFRSNSSRRAVDQFTHILDVQGIPRFFTALERTLLKGFQSFGGYLPDVAVPLVKDRMHKETANVILPSERKYLQAHLQKRREQGLRMNVNILGEAILSETEAERRLEEYLETLQREEIEVVSVKISTLYSQISPLARDHTIRILCERLEMLYRTAANLNFVRADGSRVPKFVYLDMEEYRDMSLTAETFMETLSRPGLETVRAGIVLQAYLPDSFATQKVLNWWARNRVAQGGAPITLRIVKGANMEMERVEASLRGWEQAPFTSKVETDANFKRMIQEACRPENASCVRVGVASHNLFDVAYALVLAHRHGVLDHVQFEMLEGMANHQRRALFEVDPHLLLYSPVCSRQDFIHAIGYLIRRLDENTGPDNFLRHTFQLDLDSDIWKRLEQGFREAFDHLPTIQATPRRQQDRRVEAQEPPACPEPTAWRSFRNEPDTDFSLVHHYQWARSFVEDWQRKEGAKATEIPAVVNGEFLPPDSATTRECQDPSRPGAVVGRYRRATQEDVDAALDCGQRDPDGWRAMDPTDRYAMLGRVAQEIRLARADLIGAAMADGGKTIVEVDPEISEAVDFVEFYRSSALDWQTREGWSSQPRGLVTVISPWNFPVAIPCGGVAAALAAGNTVILKPASDAVLPAWELCQCFWKGGVSKRTLQFVPCSGGQEGRGLVTDDRVDAVILTGGTDTALTMLRDRPSVQLFAETGGKNATIVTGLADRDLAIKNVLHSAFSHSGQKCSATSLLLLEAEVFDDSTFKEALREAAESLIIGSVWDLPTRMGPLIRPPSEDLARGLKGLEAGESWLVRPHPDPDNPQLWSPGIKWQVPSGNFTHMTELFGPVLGVMRYEKLEEAIGLVNQTGYGLTSGLESLDDREQAIWKEGVRAGNLYINRPTTGAIVLRQPFGGVGKSSVGPGIKAGGPNYVAPLMTFEDKEGAPREEAAEGILPELQSIQSAWQDANQPVPSELERLVPKLNGLLGSYSQAMREEFGNRHDHFQLLGQDNERLYRPLSHLRIRLHPEDTAFDIMGRILAARAAGCGITVSLPVDGDTELTRWLEMATEPWAGGIEFIEEADDELTGLLQNNQTDRIRFAGRDRVPDDLWKTVAQSGAFLATAPVSRHGRIELLHYFEEQSLSMDYHRYGNLGGRQGLS